MDELFTVGRVAGHLDSATRSWEAHVAVLIHDFVYSAVRRFGDRTALVETAQNREGTASERLTAP